LRPTNAPTIFAMRAIDVDLHQVESALAVRCSSDLVIFRYRSGVAADNNYHRYIPELLRAAADVRFDPEATKIARATGDTRTSRFSPRPEAV
jgi:hypothetical protein